MAWRKVMLPLFISFLIAQGANSVRMLEVRIPSHVIRENNVKLECRFDLEGEALYSVKWYKDGNEFYRFLPGDHPPVQVFALPGVTVDLDNSSDTQVVLQTVNLLTTGRYKCEVSAEAPAFQTVTDHGDMVVVALPDEGPRITGGRPRYQYGDTVRINCTSGRSKPVAHLNWFINGDQVDPSFLRGPETFYHNHDGLETSILGLEFKIKPKHFKHGDLKLKCLATIGSVYWRSNEESVEGEKPQRTPVLESRETVPTDKSRADRVQAGGGFAAHGPSAPLLAGCLLTLAALGLTSASRVTSR